MPEKTEGELYKIRAKGQLDSHWATWFESMTLTTEDRGETLLWALFPTSQPCKASSSAYLTLVYHSFQFSESSRTRLRMYLTAITCLL